MNFHHSEKTTGYINLNPIFHRMRALSFMIVSALLIQASCKTDAPIYESILDESYGADVRNKMDVLLPPQRDSATATVILIHGGAWIAGDKKDFSNSGFTGRLMERGFAVASINYRYACGDIRKQMEDVQRAIERIRAKSVEWKISGNRFALLGGSAGGHLAMLYAHAFDSLSVVKAVVSMAGPTDLTDSLFHRYAANYQISQIFVQLLGASLQESPQRYRDASPVFHHRNVPSLFIHGSRDDLVPHEHSARMNDSLAAAGIISEAIIFDNAGHNVFGDKGENLDVIADKIDEWMMTHLSTR